jgi:hypothetical protein
MSFYVTLPSNSSKDVYPNNTLTKFSTKLKTPIKLEGFYEVALIEAILPVNWKNRYDGAMILKLNTLSVKCDVRFYVYETLTELVNSIAEFYSKSPIQLEIKYNLKLQKVFISIPETANLEFINGIEKDFGFNENQLTGRGVDAFSSDFKVRDSINNIDTFYVYSDIVEYQIVGDINAPLLQVVSSATITGSVIDKIYDTPHYVPVLRNNIETIDIDIRTDLGNPIQFTSGRVVIKLHFRKRSIY